MRRGRLVGYVLLAGALSMGMLYIGMKNLAVFQVEHVELESRVVEALLERTSVANRPPLKDLLDEYGNITGAPEDLEKLVDFVIIGFGKCGTSSMMNWLGLHPDIACHQRELWDLMLRRPHELIAKLYNDLPANAKIKGYKSPAELTQNHILEYHSRLWPHVKFFVGIRHPVWWFQSLYNFRIQNQGAMRPINELKGVCQFGMKNTCTAKGNFANDLMRLGKTNFNGMNPMTDLEKKISRYHWSRRYNVSEVPYMPNEVFLFEISQLGDKDRARSAQFREDVGAFLGLGSPLPPMHHVVPGRKLPDKKQAERDAMKIDICENAYQPIRNELMNLAHMSSKWIRTRFLELPGVHVSSRPHFEQLLEGWMDDPCNATKT